MMYNVILSLYRPNSFAQRARRKLAGIFGWKSSTPTPTDQDLIRKYAAGKTFADIGCMWGINGANSFFAESCGAKRVLAVDVFTTEQFAAERSRLNSRVEFVLGDINETDTVRRVGKSNVVFSAGVLYHTPDPFSFLVRLRSICDEVLILSTALIPEMPGLRNTAIFYPLLDEAWCASNSDVSSVLR
jgi:2-polyprenyl-3-methyl-5-hydroxy-6-metoxy-1,4-benzoquinol methylase